MATREVTEHPRGHRERDLGHRAEVAGDRVTGRHDETKWALLTTEFWAMVVGIAAVLIAAAAADNFDAPRAWLLVAIVVAGYVVSRGIAKAGTGHLTGGWRDSRQGRASPISSEISRNFFRPAVRRTQVANEEGSLRDFEGIRQKDRGTPWRKNEPM